MIEFVFIGNLLFTGVMTGVIWFVQVVHYPLFATVAPEQFHQYHSRHSTLTGYVVAGPMLGELVLGTALLIIRPQSLPLWWAIVCCSLAFVTWVLTFALAVPLHRQLTQGYNIATIQRLVHMNWLRTVAWSLRFALLLYGLGQLLP